MTDLTEQYEKGYSPSALQHKYRLTYGQGYELAQDFKKTQELELALRKENIKLKELLKECREILDYAKDFAYNTPCCKCINKIDQALGEDK